MDLFVKNVYIDGRIASKEHGRYISDDSSVELRNGEVILDSKGPVKKIVMEFVNSIPANSMVLGDAWERAYGDLCWDKPSKKPYPWYFFAVKDDNFTAFGVKTGPNAFCHWLISDDNVSLVIDVRCGTQGVELKEALVACEIVALSEKTEDIFASGRKFCAMMCENPLLPKEPIYGSNNWYYAYGNSSQKQIMIDTQLVAKWAYGLDNRPFMVIDAGWQPFMLMDECCSGGPYPHGNYLFPDMERLASDIKAMNVRPGLWYRPLKTAETLPYNWFIRPKERILDPTIPEVLEILREDARRLTSWGFELLKHDFSTYDIFGLWGFEMTDGIKYKDEYAFNDRSKTTAQAIKMMYQAILDGASGAYIIGCNTVSHLAAGLTHIQRIGDDTSGIEWERTRKMGVNCLAFRAVQHNIFYSADADCVGITNHIAWNRNVNWLRLVAQSGTPLFVSADPKALNADIENEIMEAFKIASKPQKTAEPLDWLKTRTPEKWKLNGSIQTFNWS